MTNGAPRVALTLGDVAGIGPEVVVSSLADKRLRETCRPVVVGHPAVVARAQRQVGVELSFVDVASPTEIDWSRSEIPCWNPSIDEVAQVPAGKIDARAGRAAYDYLVAATRAALRGEIDAITTAPLNKAALHAAGLNFPGHTEILAHECGVHDFAMMLYLPPGEPLKGPAGLGVAHVTLHTSIQSVPGLLSTKLIYETIHLVSNFLIQIGCSSPRIGVCALNPHAGEEGLFGDEESRLIAPAVESAVQSGVNAIGPIPADALLRRAVQGEFDGVAAMYHDQGHIALKLIGFERAVNVTLGLPVVRTSPSHGTAFDIAWKGLARTEGFVEAVRTAVQLVRSRANSTAQ
ncbi:4-hydroxythreonine-4-phosphate dehydrogenase PdxA [Schlesneria sp. T3-172]|uniref:4-hydroxythreonine-4-phosphate dehydrogenase PdxA n=1 Tax=Schlesneria sphaerica TaxID=3373610 RepID=UPI0037C893DF